MKKARINQGIVGVMALVMVLSQVPTSAIAEALDQNGEVAQEQTTESGNDSNTDTDANGNAADSANAGTTNASQQQSDAPVDDAADDKTANTDASSDNADASTSQVAPHGNAGIAVQAVEPLRYHGSDTLTKGTVLSYVKANVRDASSLRIAPEGSSNWKEIGTWNTLLVKDQDSSLAPGSYSAQEYKKTGGPWYKPTYEWVSCGSFSIQRYWTATFSAAGCSDGGAQVDGQVTTSYDIDEGATKTFTVKQVDDYKVVSVKNGDTELAPNEDGSYTIPASADSNIVVTYKAAAEATIEVWGDEGLAGVTVGGAQQDAEGNITVNHKKPGDIVATPADGCAITGVKLVDVDKGSDVELDKPSYAKCTATVSNVPALAKDGHYALIVTTVKAEIKAIDGAEVGILGRSDKSSYDQVVFDAAFDQQGSIPAGLTAKNVKITYNAGGTFGDRWQPLDFSRGWLDFGQHEFGENGDGSTEQIRFEYAGDDQYPASTVEVTVRIVDGRYKTEMSINSNVSIEYNADAAAMREELYNKLNPSVTYLDDAGEVETVPGLSADSFDFDGLTLPADAGEHTGITVKYKGTDSEGDQLGYQPCSTSDVTVTVTKAPAKVKVSSKNLKYGQTVSIADLVSSDPSADETKPVTVIAGIDGDAAGYLSIDLSYYSPTVQDLLNKYLKLDQGVSLSGLLDILDNDATMSALKLALKVTGVENPDQIVDGLKSALSALQKYGLGASTIALGGTPSKAGVYVVAAATTSGNYKTSVSLGYLTIAPKTADVSLAWNEELPHKALTHDEAQGFDFGVKAFDGDTDVTDAANVHVTYAGVTTAGDAYLSSEAPTEPGTYTQTATVIGGNYFAKPISRFFAINRIETKVVLAGDDFTYNALPQGPSATVITSTGLVDTTGTALSRLYSGITKSGKMYLSSEAPTEAGRYAATVTYPGNALYGSSSATKWFDIEKADAAISVADDTVTYDGSPHGLTATATIAGGAVDVSDQLILSYNGKAELPTDAGTYEVTVTFPGNDNINPGAKKATLTIERAAVTISLGDRSTVYDGAAQQLTGTASHGDEDLSGQLAYTYNGAAKAPADAGTYEVTATFPGTKNLEKASATATLAIAPRAVTVTCGDHTIVSGDTQPVYQTQVADGADGQPAWVGKKSLEDALDLVVSDSRTAATKDTPGTYGITATTDNANFQIVDLAGEPTSAAGTLTVLNRVKVSAGEHGSVAVSGKRQMAENGIDYGASAGDVLNLTATPLSDAYEFKGWKIVSGDAALDDESAADATLTIGDENIEVEAIFEAKPTKAVKVSVKNDEGGTATVDPAEAYLGQTVTVKADAVEGYSFDHWVVLSGGIELASATDATTTFTMGDSAVQLQAVFKKSATPEPAPSDPSKPGNPSKPNGKADNGNGAKTANTTKSADTTKSDTKLANTGDRMGICAPTAVAGILFAGIGTALLRRRRQ